MARTTQKQRGQQLPKDEELELGQPAAELVDDALWNHPSVWSEQAEQAFAKARRRARREVLAGRLRRHDTCLLSFHDVIGRRRVSTPSDTGLRTVPISKIVGSIDKPCSFTRSLNPGSEDLRGRWKKAYLVAHGLRGYQPIDVYQVGDAFFVVDGHFRASVTTALGGDSIRAYVREWT